MTYPSPDELRREKEREAAAAHRKETEPPLWFKTIGLILLSVGMVLAMLVIIGLLAWATKGIWGEVF